jgi:chromosome segregation ATPase
MPAQNRAFLDARDALESLRQPRKKTEAERRLDEVLHNLKTKKSDAAREAARRKIEQIKTKLNALKLAAGSATATGDAKLARKAAKEIRDAARELGKALNEAGGSGGTAPVVNGNSDARAEQVAMEKAQVERAQALANGNDLAGLKSEAAGLVTELKKIMRKLRETAFHPEVVRKDRAAMEKMLTETERELSGLQAAALPSPGGAVDLSA